jgi:hypothetical protein
MLGRAHMKTVCRGSTGSDGPKVPPEVKISGRSRALAALAPSGAAGVSLSQKRLPIVVSHPHVVAAPIVGGPGHRSLHHSAGRDRSVSHAERQLDDRPLCLEIIGRPAWIPEGDVDEQESRHPGLGHDVVGAPDDQGRDARLFQVPRYQTHGLVTDRSQRNEKYQPDTVSTRPALDLGGVVSRSALAVPGGNTVETWTEATDYALIGQRLKMIQR